MSKQQFTDALIEASSTKSISSEEWVIINVIENMFSHCICGKNNNMYYVLWNKVNKNIVNVGFDCIGKYLPELKADAVALCKQFTYKKTSKNPKRMCFGCHKHNIPTDTEDWRNICKSCWGSGSRNVVCPMLGNKVCTQCFELTLLPTSNNSICLACYKGNNDFANMDHNRLRACSLCGELKILKSDPDFKDKCGDCFRHAKQREEMEEKRPCSLCNELLIPVSKPDYVDKCTACFKSAAQTVEKRPCSDCGQLKIPVTQPAFKNRCVDCFKSNITNNVQRECSMCLQLTIPANKPSYINKCDVCYKNSNDPQNLSNNLPGPKSMGGIPTIPTKKGGIPKATIKTKEEDVDISAQMGNLNLMQSLMGKK